VIGEALVADKLAQRVNLLNARASGRAGMGAVTRLSHDVGCDVDRFRWTQ